MDGTRIIRIEIDQDEDGKVDRWEHYGVNNNKVEQIGSSKQGRRSSGHVAYPDATGFLCTVEYDTNRNGSIDKRDHFVQRPDKPAERVLSIVEYEFNAAGAPGSRLYYGTDGSFQKSEVLR